MAKNKEIRITEVPPLMRDEVENVAKNSGQSMSHFCKGLIREGLKTIPDHYKKPSQFKD